MQQYQVVYICSSWLLAVESQAEKKITVAKAKEIKKMTTTFIKNDNF